MNKEQLTYVIANQYQGETIRFVLKNEFHFSKKLLATLKARKSVLLNGSIGYYSQTVHQGDLLSVDFSYPEETSVLPEKMDLSIVYEDEDFLCIEKPPFMACHPVGTHQHQTVANGICQYWLDQGAKKKFRPAGRLDRNTSGLMLICQNGFSQAFFVKSTRKGQVEKTYLAIIDGHLSSCEGIIDMPIGRILPDRLQRMVCQEGKPSQTAYRVIQETSQHSLLEIRLLTGRTHQIRVHLAHIGHPLVGDTLYGGSDLKLDRQALHCHRLRFPHPRLSGKWIEITSKLPTDMRRFLDENQ